MSDYLASHPLSGSHHALHRPSIIARVFRALDVWRQRRHLENLPAHMRRDIGLSSRDIAEEAARPLWDVPQSWRF